MPLCGWTLHPQMLGLSIHTLSSLESSSSSACHYLTACSCSPSSVSCLLIELRYEGPNTTPKSTKGWAEDWICEGCSWTAVEGRHRCSRLFAGSVVMFAVFERPGFQVSAVSGMSCSPWAQMRPTVICSIWELVGRMRLRTAEWASRGTLE